MTSSLYLETAPSANDWSSYSTYGDSDPTSWLQSEPGAGAVPYDGLWPNDPWQDHDLSSYRWSDKTNNFMPYPSYYSPALLYNTSLPAEAHYRTDFDSSSGPAPAQPISSISHISGPTHHMKRDCTRQSLPPSQDHRSCIARASDDFLSQASSLFTGVCYTTKRDCPLDINPSITEKYSRAPSKKRSIDALDGYNVKEEDGNRSSSVSAASDTRCLPHPHMIVPSQSTVGAAPHPRILHMDNHTASLYRIPPHPERDSLLLCHEAGVSIPKEHSNKRFRRSTEELVQQEGRVIPTTTATWTSPDDPHLKSGKKGGEQKKQALACLFCRERKIACGRPSPHSPDQTCNQCSRRRIKCAYPTESRRGQHKRRRKTLERDPICQATNHNASRTSPVPSNPSTVKSTSPPSAPNVTHSPPT